MVVSIGKTVIVADVERGRERSYELVAGRGNPIAGALSEGSSISVQ